MTHPATDLRTQLATAARAAYLEGASTRQIDMIVALARGSGDFNILTGGHLTGREASRIIDEMVAAGVVADWNVTEAELDDQDAAASAIEERIAYKKASKKQKEAEKKARANRGPTEQEVERAAARASATKAAAEAKVLGEQQARDALEAPFKAKWLAAPEHERLAILIAMSPWLAHDKSARKEITRRWMEG